MDCDMSLYEKCKKELIELYGEIQVEGQEYDFDKFTKYYQEEMGYGIAKRFLIFKKTLEKKDIADIKIKTTEIEKNFAIDDKRTINLDPGFISKEELVLASFKKGTNYKEQISDTVYAHKVLEFKEDDAIEFWHTFPDYRANKEFFLDLVKNL